MLRRTLKRVKEVVDKMRLPAVVRLRRSFWRDARNGTGKEKRQFFLMQLTGMSATLKLCSCAIAGQHAEWLVNPSENDIDDAGAESLAGVLAQCPALAHLDLSGNYHFGAAGAERLAGVLGQCRVCERMLTPGVGLGDVPLGA